MRPTFKYKNQDVKAGGILFFVRNRDKKFYLLRKHKNWSDIGGKTEPTDNDILDTIVREVVEETNNVLLDPSHNKQQATDALRKLLDETPVLDIFYNKGAKYVMLKVELPEHLYYMDNKRFGKTEETTSQDHYFSWINIVARQKLHPRLRFHLNYKNIFN